MGEYIKPHLTYDEQLAKMKGRGVECADDHGARRLLRTVGYYRLSAYVYPFREMLPEAEQRVASPAQYRSDIIRPGTTFEHIEDLWRFDRKLRLKCLDALETVEIGLRTQVAYVLGARDPFGHVHRQALDEEACTASARRKDLAGNHVDGDEFDEWIRRYDKLKADAKSEDFVRHHLHKYGHPLPIWVAVEFLDFGALSKLFGLLDKRDQNEIARELGVKGGTLLRAWIRDLNYVRNMSAHHNRMWNRSLTYKARTFNQTQVDTDLRHAAQSGDRDKIYVQLACLAYVLRRIDPRSTWHLDLRTLVKKFPAIPGMSPETDMGFPTGWQAFPLWMTVPAK